MKQLRVGVVGVGYLGRFHAEKYASMDAVDLVGVADTDMSQAASIAGKYRTTAYSTYQDLFGKVDARATRTAGRGAGAEKPRTALG